MELKLGSPSGPCEISTLLIVPYGIETSQAGSCMNNYLLLIVPYGIETISSGDIAVPLDTFNRTLWN